MIYRRRLPRITTHKPSEAARERSRAYAATSPLTGHGVAPFANNSAEAVGDGPRLVRASPLTGQGVAPFANNSAETVGDGPRLVRASPLTGQGVAPFGNNRRPCLKQPEAGRPCRNSRRLC
ncbi:MAG: hypothetical protein LBD24_01875 [Spirochaetaceae bacterium]|nr:hypothetical protein [Spirochaetaceae bacterium]